MIRTQLCHFKHRQTFYDLGFISDKEILVETIIHEGYFQKLLYMHTKFLKTIR